MEAGERAEKMRRVMGSGKRSEEMRRVGKSALSVPQLGLGGGSWDMTPDTLVCETVDAAFSGGVRLYDTAPAYGIGRSERRLGVALSNYKRDDFILNSKVGKFLVPEPILDLAGAARRNGATDEEFDKANIMNPAPRDERSGLRVVFDYSHDAIVRQHADSLQRMGTCRLDSLVIHDVDHGYHSTPLSPPGLVDRHLAQLGREGGGFRALESLRSGGAIKAIGAGLNYELRNFAHWPDDPTLRGHTPMEQLACGIADAGDLDFFLLAGPYHLLDTRALDTILPLCEERGMGCFGGPPFATGVLATGPVPGATYMYEPIEKRPEIAEKVSAMDRICKAHGVALASAALQFPIAHPAVACVIPGATSPEEVQQNIEHMNATVPLDMWRALKEQGLLDSRAPTPLEAADASL